MISFHPFHSDGYSIRIDICMNLSILYFKGSQVEISNFNIIFLIFMSLKIVPVSRLRVKMVK